MDQNTQIVRTQTIRTSSLIIIDCCSSRNIHVGPSSVYFISSIITPKTQSVPTTAALRFLDTNRMIVWRYIKTTHPHRHFKTWLGLVVSVSNNLMRYFLFRLYVDCFPLRWSSLICVSKINDTLSTLYHAYRRTLPVWMSAKIFRTLAFIINCTHTFASLSAVLYAYTDVDDIIYAWCNTMCRYQRGRNLCGPIAGYVTSASVNEKEENYITYNIIGISVYDMFCGKTRGNSNKCAVWFGIIILY